MPRTSTKSSRGGRIGFLAGSTTRTRRAEGGVHSRRRSRAMRAWTSSSASIATSSRVSCRASTGFGDFIAKNKEPNDGRIHAHVQLAFWLIRESMFMEAAMERTATRAKRRPGRSFDMLFVHDDSRRPRPLCVLSLLALLLITPLAYARACDPTWIPGLYDVADFDDVVLFLVETAGGTVPGPSVLAVGAPPMLVVVLPSVHA